MVSYRVGEPNEKISLSTLYASWADGLTDEEIFSFQLDTGKIFAIDRVEFRQKGGGSSSDAQIDVYDADNATSVASQTLGGVNRSPGQTQSGSEILVRLTNNTGNTIDASIFITGEIRL